MVRKFRVVAVFALLVPLLALAQPAQGAVPTPTGVEVASGDGVVTVSWDAPDDWEVGPLIDRWAIRWKRPSAGTSDYEYKQAANDDVTEIVEGGSVTRLSFDIESPDRNLTNGTFYGFEVRSIDTDTGEKSNFTTCDTGCFAYPSSLAAVASNDAVTIRWETDGNELDIDKYRIRYRRLGETSWKNKFSGDAAVSHTIDNLYLNSNYEFEFRAYTDAGETSDWRAASATLIGDLTDDCAAGGRWYDGVGAAGTYEEDRIALEAHAWWFPSGENEGGKDTGDSFGHTHLVSCVPTAEAGNVVTSDQLDLDIHIVAHMPLQGFTAADCNNGHPCAVGVDGELIGGVADDVSVVVNRIQIRGKTDAGRDVLVDDFPAQGAPFLECDAGETCMKTLTFSGPTGDPANPFDDITASGGPAIDLFDSPRPNAQGKAATHHDGFTTNGIKQLRIMAFHEIRVGTENDYEVVAETRAILRSPFNLNLDQPASSTAPLWCYRVNGTYEQDCEYDYSNETETSGWFVENEPGAGGYSTIGVRDLIQTTPYEGSTLTIPLHVEPDPCTTDCRVRRMPITGYDVYIDGSFHHASACPPGVACRVAGETFATPMSTAHQPTLSVDISNLDPGPHTLILIVRQPMVDGQPDRQGGTYDVAEAMESTLFGELVIPFLVGS